MREATRENLLLIMALCLLAFSIPFPFIYSSIALILLSLVWLIFRNKKEAFERLRQRGPLWAWLLYYALHAVSYFYSENKDQAAFDLQVKLGLFILPLLVGTMDLGIKDLQKIMGSFCLGITVVACIALTRSAAIWEETGFSGIMFYHNLVRDFDANAVYMSWYVLFSIGLLFMFPWERPRPTLRAVLLLIQVVFLVLLSSRMLTVLFLIFVVPLYFIDRIRGTRRRWPKLVGAASALILILGIGIGTDNPIKNRFVDLLYKPEIVRLNDFSQVPEDQINNTELRLFLWRIGLENMNDHNLWWMGAGNGDANALQNQKMVDYKIQNIDHPDPEKRSKFYNINLHNMFIQTLLMLGIVGLLPFLLMIFLPFFRLPGFYLWPPFSVFLLPSLFFLMQESCLQSHAGVIYFSFFSSIFWASYYTNKYAKTAKTQKTLPKNKN